MRELRRNIIIQLRAFFKLFEGLPRPGITIRRRGVTEPEGVENTYEGDEAAGDQTQEPSGAWVQADVENLERVTSL